jgi:hypothetical protein
MGFLFGSAGLFSNPAAFFTDIGTQLSTFGGSKDGKFNFLNMLNGMGKLDNVLGGNKASSGLQDTKDEYSKWQALLNGNKGTSGTNVYASAINNVKPVGVFGKMPWDSDPDYFNKRKGLGTSYYG